MRIPSPHNHRHAPVHRTAILQLFAMLHCLLPICPDGFVYRQYAIYLTGNGHPFYSFSISHDMNICGVQTINQVFLLLKWNKHHILHFFLLCIPLQVSFHQSVSDKRKNMCQKALLPILLISVRLLLLLDRNSWCTLIVFSS